MADFHYEVEKKLGVLSTSEKGWTKELRLVSWNGRHGKFDIREWSPGDEKMGKGITLTVEEMEKLKEILRETE